MKAIKCLFCGLCLCMMVCSCSPKSGGYTFIGEEVDREMKKVETCFPNIVITDEVRSEVNRTE